MYKTWHLRAKLSHFTTNKDNKKQKGQHEVNYVDGTFFVYESFAAEEKPEKRMFKRG